MGKRQAERAPDRRRRRLTRLLPAGLALTAVMLASGAAVAHWQDDRDAARRAAEFENHVDGPSDGGATSSPSTSRSPSPSSSPSSKPKKPKKSSTPSASPSHSSGTGTIPVPATGPGTFTTAQADGTVVGTGSRVRRYKVMVEDGIDVSAKSAATYIASVLGDRRGWTRDGVDSFKLVSSGSYDFVVKIATPGTVDRICGAAGLDTHGELDCSVGTDVVVNLKRWVLGSPQFPGPITEYRALIINHEVGHRIGHGHEGCPGPGKPAPAMMQQIKGLHGCVANAWPYDKYGHYISGPPV
ncbi:DUF3152 domain-containing protein [Streptomyces beihaiensis]|uniref:DUF3152 domain-containing protein n=1 Tax=Streptomyces beihaiensis TaxID=2984495 RepID=A0ABT3TR87_9ACTN|nr:DUF3152 domain-containing protein [Streptomyces beihaiensis]MCX3058996.1 DUF3152 domain-containing protein [Streptomyces beihaiensis]